MIRITKDNACYAMGPENPPAAEVAPGEAFCVETEDCYSGQLKGPGDAFTKDMWDTVNPATGPIAIAGAEPGQVLRVEVLEIATAGRAVMCVEHGAGALAEFIEGAETSILPIADGRLIVSEKLSVAIRPMIGVIGTAPAGEPILNGTPGEHGGNMDCKLITAGAAVSLPVSIPGALLALGDLHAVMGDGEVCICGAEVAGEVTLRATVADDAPPTPCVETADHYHLIGSALTLDECERIVLAKAHAFLTGAGLPPNDAARAMSLLCDLSVCQVVDPLKTMRYSVPKTLVAT